MTDSGVELEKGSTTFDPDEGKIDQNVSNNNNKMVSDGSEEDSAEDLKKPTTMKHKNYEEEEEHFDHEKFPMRELEFTPYFFKEPVNFNPVVSGIGIFFLWGLAVWSMVDPEGSASILLEWRQNVTYQFTWLFVGMRAIFFLFLIYTVFRFGHVKMGHQDEPPEFDTGSYFMMIFAAGMAVGLFVYGVAEPMWHQQSNFYAEAGYHTQDEVAMWAINMTVTNSAIAGWAPYLVVAVAMGLAGHRYGMPMTFRSCFYPMLGKYTWGWMGDVLDGYSIVVTVAGVCTSLGLGAIQVIAGLQFLGWIDEDISESKSTSLYNVTIWFITAIATASVISGVHAGVKFLSQLAFMLGMLLTLFIFIMDDSKFLMNLFVQEVGYFLQHSLLEMNFWTDAFAQLRPGSGRAIDGNAGFYHWMDDWVIFYQAWWTSWGCFVGLFVARISRGRTVAEVITYSMVAPILYCMVWFCVWGGAGVRQQRQAQELEVLGATYYGDINYFQNADTPTCFDVPQGNLEMDGEVIFENRIIGVTPVCKLYNSLYASFNLMYSFSFPDSLSGEGYGPFLSVLFIIGLAIYFATSSDSGSLVVDHLASNGRHTHHWFQRLFWAVTEGAVATALLSAGGAQALGAVQSASIIGGLPFCVMLLWMMQSIYKLGQYSLDNPDSYEYPEAWSPGHKRDFSMPIYGGVFNSIEWVFSLGSVDPLRKDIGMGSPSAFQTTEFFKALFVPFLPLYSILSKAYPKNKKMNLFTTLVFSMFFYTWIGLFAAYGAVTGLIPMGWAMFFCSGVLLCAIRAGFRSRYGIRSNVVADWIASTFIWPQVLVQMHLACIDLGLPDESKEED